MKLVLQQEDDKWIRLIELSRHGKPLNNAKFTNMIRYGVKPISYRKFDAERKNWLVYWEWLPFAVQTGKKFFEDLDWSSLPDKWQLYLHGASVKDEPIPEEKEVSDPYETLYLIPTAPMSVVKSVYKTLAMIYHPDQGGSTEKMTAINDAFREIQKQKTTN